MKAANWMPFYVADYLADTGRLTTEGHGAYVLLIMECWQSERPLPDDDDQLAAITRLPIARWAKLRPVLAGFFQVEEGLWRHKRVDTELAKATARMGARSNAGHRGAVARWQTHAPPDGEAIANASDGHRQNDAPSTIVHPVTSVTGEAREAKAKKGTKIPEGWEPGEQGAAYAAGRSLKGDELARQISMFVNNHTSKGSIFKNWDSAWRTWVDRCPDFSRQPGKHEANGSHDPDNEAKARARSIAKGMHISSISDHEVRRMVAAGYLTAEQAVTAGYEP